MIVIIKAKSRSSFHLMIQPFRMSLINCMLSREVVFVSAIHSCRLARNSVSVKLLETNLIFTESRQMDEKRGTGMRIPGHAIDTLSSSPQFIKHTLGTMCNHIGTGRVSPNRNPPVLQDDRSRRLTAKDEEISLQCRHYPDILSSHTFCGEVRQAWPSTQRSLTLPRKYVFLISAPNVRLSKAC